MTTPRHTTRYYHTDVGAQTLHAIPHNYLLSVSITSKADVMCIFTCVPPDERAQRLDLYLSLYLHLHLHLQPCRIPVHLPCTKNRSKPHQRSIRRAGSARSGVRDEAELEAGCGAEACDCQGRGSVQLEGFGSGKHLPRPTPRKSLATPPLNPSRPTRFQHPTRTPPIERQKPGQGDASEARRHPDGVQGARGAGRVRVSESDTRARGRALPCPIRSRVHLSACPSRLSHAPTHIHP